MTPLAQRVMSLFLSAIQAANQMFYPVMSFDDKNAPFVQRQSAKGVAKDSLKN